MADESICLLSAAEQAAMIHRKEISSRELLDAFVARVEKMNPEVNAVCTLAVESAHQQAEEADADAANGEWWGPLHGLPITIKDAIETAGIRSTGGAVELSDHVPTTDAPAVARLREAGAIVFGKTNLPRWSGDGQTFNEMFGTTNNPWDTSRIPGGSSGGPAVAVACGFTSFELGTDIGGSVRMPSHCCGTFGHKPSYGLVPQRGYLDSVGGGTTDADINVFGPMARSAADLDLLLGVLAGPVPSDASAWRVELPEPKVTSLAGARLATWLDDPVMPGERAMVEVLRTAGDAARAAGATVTEVRPPVDPSEQFDLFNQLIVPAVSVSSPQEIGDAMAGSHADWLRADRRRAALRATWADWFADYDALLTPVMCTTAFPHDQEGDFMSRKLTIDGAERAYVMMIWWTGMFGVLGLPVTVPPVGRTAAGLPVGIQVVAPHLHDREAISIAGLLADVAGGYDVPPGY